MFCNALEILDPGFHRDDGKRPFSTFYDGVKINTDFFGRDTVTACCLLLIPYLLRREVMHHERGKEEAFLV